MMNICSLLNQERIATQQPLCSKKKVLEVFSSILAADIENYSQGQIFDQLVIRDRLGSMGLGHGVALPHCRLSNLSRPLSAVLTLQKGIDFDAPDAQLVDIVFCLVVPEHADQEHLQILAQLAKYFADTKLCQQIRQAQSGQALLNCLYHWQSHAAA